MRKRLSTLSETNSIKSSFLNYFTKVHNHKPIPSASLIPPNNDNSLLFINAGMAPFKQQFTGEVEAMEKFNSTRLASAQKCVRAGGKHNDLDMVGFTSRHHTMFEMLGNFSFGDYFKEESIFYCWDYLTKVLGLDASRLIVTVLRDDVDTEMIWKKVAGVDKVVFKGKEDNFWAMGNSGPCGPCTELFYDLDPNDSLALSEEERYLEIWNIVFMEFVRDGSGLKKLPKPCVDTGMGLERIMSVVQNVASNYHTDIFLPVMDAAALAVEKAGGVEMHRNEYAPSDSLLGSMVQFERDQLNNKHVCALRVIADHARAIHALIVDGVYPKNVGRGYVVRRLIRRAIRYGHVLGVDDIFLHQTIRRMFNVDENDLVCTIVRQEEENFFETFSKGSKELHVVAKACQQQNWNSIPGKDAFKLHDTFGLPIDIVQELALEKYELTVQMSQFDELLNQQRERARQAQLRAGKIGGIASIPTNLQSLWKNVHCKFIGYSTTHSNNSKILATYSDYDSAPGGVHWVSISPTPFYATGGGQVGDRGSINCILKNNGGDDQTVHLVVKNAMRLHNDCIALQVEIKDESMSDLAKMDAFASIESATLKDHTVEATVSANDRTLTSVHHSATHLLNQALSTYLGSHVTQAGSYVDSTKLRFDFVHAKPLSKSDLSAIEGLVNEYATTNQHITSTDMNFDDAMNIGAKCMRGQNYGKRVRVVSMGNISHELCGGTHAFNTNEIYPFIIKSESSIGSGVRRIECIAGKHAIQHLLQKSALVDQAKSMLHAKPEENLIDQISSFTLFKNRLENCQKQLVQSAFSQLHTPIFVSKSATGEEYATYEMPLSAACFPDSKSFTKALRQFAIQMSSYHPVVIVFSGPNIMITSSTISCKEILKSLTIADHPVQGGGNPCMIQGKHFETIEKHHSIKF